MRRQGSRFLFVVLLLLFASSLYGEGAIVRAEQSNLPTVAPIAQAEDASFDMLTLWRMLSVVYWQYDDMLQFILRTFVAHRMQRIGSPVCTTGKTTLSPYMPR